jgi:hypothetical protein
MQWLSTASTPKLLVLAGWSELGDMRLGCKRLTVNVKGINDTEYCDITTLQGK